MLNDFKLFVQYILLRCYEGDNAISNQQLLITRHVKLTAADNEARETNSCW